MDIVSLTDEAHREHLAFNNRLRAESHPDDPPRTLEDHLSRWRNIPPIVTIYNWVVRDSASPGNPIVGVGELQTGNQEANQKRAFLRIAVLPERRREGIARRLLQPMVTTALEQGRTLLMAGSNDRAPAGARFLEALGAERGMDSHTNQLSIAELDRATLRAYQEESERRGEGSFELLRCDSPIPDEILVEATDLFNRYRSNSSELAPSKIGFWLSGQKLVQYTGACPGEVY